MSTEKKTPEEGDITGLGFVNKTITDEVDVRLEEFAGDWPHVALINIRFECNIHERTSNGQASPHVKHAVKYPSTIISVQGNSFKECLNKMQETIKNLKLTIK